MATKRYRVTGKVQGVGFRATVKRLAKRYGVNGYAENKNDGSVDVVLQGEKDAIKNVYTRIKNSPGFSKVHRVQEQDAPDEDYDGFTTR